MYAHDLSVHFVTWKLKPLKISADPLSKGRCKRDSKAIETIVDYHAHSAEINEECVYSSIAESYCAFAASGYGVEILTLRQMRAVFSEQSIRSCDLYTNSSL